MKHRKLMMGALAAAIGLAAVPQAADAAWKGIRWFNCEATNGNWNFDGLYGPHTQRAVKNFQAARGLRVDGVAGPQTMAALGLKYRRNLSCGMGGNDVFMLQQALAAEGFWYGGQGKPTASPEAVPTLAPMPSPEATSGWEEPPVMVTPAPAQPTPMPEAQPTPMPEETPEPFTATPMPEETPPPMVEEEAAVNEPTLEVGVGTWFVPGNAGSMNYDFSFQRPTWTADATLWLSNWGVGGALTVFNQSYVTWRTTPYFAQNTYMYDALLKYRFDGGYFHLFGGYRGIGMADVNFGTLGFGLDTPIAGDWLWLRAKGQGGLTPSTTGWFADGQAGLGLQFNPVSLDLGFRHFTLNTGVDPEPLHINGPTATVKIKF